MLDIIKRVVKSDSPHKWHFRLFSVIFIGLMVWGMQLNSELFWVSLTLAFVAWMLSYSTKAMIGGLGFLVSLKYADELFNALPEVFGRFEKLLVVAGVMTFVVWGSMKVFRMINKAYRLRNLSAWEAEADRRHSLHSRGFSHGDINCIFESEQAFEGMFRRYENSKKTV